MRTERCPLTRLLRPGTLTKAVSSLPIQAPFSESPSHARDWAGNWGLIRGTRTQPCPPATPGPVQGGGGRGLAISHKNTA